MSLKARNVLERCISSFLPLVTWKIYQPCTIYPGLFSKPHPIPLPRKHCLKSSFALNAQVKCPLFWKPSLCLLPPNPSSVSIPYGGGGGGKFSRVSSALYSYIVIEWESVKLVSALHFYLVRDKSINSHFKKMYIYYISSILSLTFFYFTDWNWDDS